MKKFLETIQEIIEDAKEEPFIAVLVVTFVVLCLVLLGHFLL